MTKPRRNVKFQHRGSMNGDNRRPSSSDISEGASEPGSPTRNGDAMKGQVIQEEVSSFGAGRVPLGWEALRRPHLLTDTVQKDGDPPVSDYEKKKATFITRTIWTLVMIGIFLATLFSGHIYVIIIVTAVQIVSFKEVIAIANVPSRAKNLRFTKSLNWYFLASTMYFLYGESVIYYFKHILLVDKVLLPFATHHRFISFILYVMGKNQLIKNPQVISLLTLVNL
jgi:phosphatidate cytidylyltransferase